MPFAQRAQGARRLSLLIVMLLALQLLSACAGWTQTEQNDRTPVAAEPTPPATTTPAIPTASATPEIEAPTATQKPSGSVSAARPLSLPRLEYGVNAHLFYTDRERALTLTNNAGFDWVRQQIHWKDIEGPKGQFGWQEVDSIVAAAEAHNIKLLLTVVRSPTWAREDGTDGMPDDPKDLGDFVEVLAERYKGRVEAYEIWNEQNLHYENGGRVTPADAGRYVELLMEAYTRIKAVDPDVYIVAGAPTSTGVNDPNVAIDDLTYLRLMYSYKDGIISDYFDIQAVHPGGAANPPHTLWPSEPSQAPGWNNHSTFYFRHVENVRRVMEEYGMDDHQVWITEFGWATANTTPDYEYGNLISMEQQGQFILDALHWTRNNYPWVGAVFVWNLNFSIHWGQQGNPLHEQASFSILNPDWSPRPAFDKIQGFIHAVRQEEGP